MILQKLIFPNNSFDLIICNHVLEHVLRDDLAISEIYRVLKKNGMAFLMVPVDNTLEKNL